MIGFIGLVIIVSIYLYIRAKMKRLLDMSDAGVRIGNKLLELIKDFGVKGFIDSRPIIELFNANLNERGANLIAEKFGLPISVILTYVENNHKENYELIAKVTNTENLSPDSTEHYSVVNIVIKKEWTQDPYELIVILARLIADIFLRYNKHVRSGDMVSADLTAMIFGFAYDMKMAREVNRFTRITYLNDYEFEYAYKKIKTIIAQMNKN